MPRAGLKARFDTQVRLLSSLENGLQPRQLSFEQISGTAVANDYGQPSKKLLDIKCGVVSAVVATSRGPMGGCLWDPLTGGLPPLVSPRRSAFCLVPY